MVLYLEMVDENRTSLNLLSGNGLLKFPCLGRAYFAKIRLIPKVGNSTSHNSIMSFDFLSKNKKVNHCVSHTTKQDNK